MAFFVPRLLVPVVALCAGTWFGMGKPPPEEVEAWARPHLVHGVAVARAAMVGLLDRLGDALGGPHPPRPRPPPRLREEIPYAAVDPSQLPDPAALPRLNPETTMRKAWLVAEGPARAVDAPHRLVTLTFDDGPVPETTPAVLKLLTRHEAKATFFFIGRYLDGDEPRAVAARAIAKEVASAGHFIGNHSHDHHCLPLDARPHALSQIDLGATSIERAIGRRPNLFRPPYGQLDPWMESALRDRRMELVLWSIEVGDARRHDVETMVQSLVAQLEHAGGGIVLLHDLRPSTVQVLERLLDWLDHHRFDPASPQQRGYEVVDLVTYMRATAAAPQPFSDRGELERARSEAWRRIRPRHRPPPPTPRTEGHEPVL